jgi:acyl-coenzyme A thioesterase PaaI-like protein
MFTERSLQEVFVEEADDELTQRIRAAGALRSLGHAIVGHHVDDDVLDQLASSVESLLPVVESGSLRDRPADDMKRRLFEAPPADGDSMDHFPDCVVSGLANPMGVAISVHREGDDAVATVSLGAAFGGAPGRAHGGIVAAIFDDVMGFVLSMISTPAFTGRLCVDYLAPTPVGEDIEFRARLDKREGRKIFIVGEASHAGVQCAAVQGLFIAIPPERFGL